jgi:ribosomal protein S18 acetylase RimI-like enzyme
MVETLPREASAQDLKSIKQLWWTASALGKADRAFTDAAIEHALADWHVVGPPEALTAAALIKEVKHPNGLVFKVEPLLATDPDAERMLLLSIIGWSQDLRPSRVQVWSGASDEVLLSLGFMPVRTFWRMDRDQMMLQVAPPKLEVSLVRGERDQPAERWVSTYNKAFENEWGYMPESATRWESRRQKLRYNPDLHWAAVSRDDTVTGLILCSLQYYSNHPVLVGSIDVLCTHPDFRHNRIAINLMSTGLSQLGRAGAKAAAVRTDVGSPSKSFEIYAGLGFNKGLVLTVWERTA